MRSRQMRATRRPFGRTVSVILLIGVAAALTACGSPPPPGATGAPAGGGTGPVEIVTKSGVTMDYVPTGEFTMGSAQGNPDEAPPHRVSVSAFLMDKVPVTHEMFVKVQL